MELKHTTREEWLTEAYILIKERVFRPAGHDVPILQVSIGFPSRNALSTKTRRIGECWKTTAHKANLNQIFITPLEDDPVTILDTLTHELVHAVDDCKHKHNKEFQSICKDIGLTEGRPKSAHAGPELHDLLVGLLVILGPLPHDALTPTAELKKQTTRLIKLECPDCGYIIRTTAKWIENGLPVCCCGTEFKTVGG